jgi:hypothetical protein
MSRIARNMMQDKQRMTPAKEAALYRELAAKVGARADELHNLLGALRIQAEELLNKADRIEARAKRAKAKARGAKTPAKGAPRKGAAPKKAATIRKSRKVGRRANGAGEMSRFAVGHPVNPADAV